MAGNGAAERGNPERTSALAASASGIPTLTVYGNYAFGSQASGLDAVRVGMAIPVAVPAIVVAEVTWRRLGDLIEDPAIPDDGLVVQDFEVRLGMAYTIDELRTSVGLTGYFFYSEVFATSIKATGLGVSIFSHALGFADVAAGVVGLGPRATSSASVGETRYLKQPLTARLGLRVPIWTGKCCSVHVFGDYSRESGDLESDNVGISGRLLLRRVVAASFGITRVHDISRGNLNTRVGLGFGIVLGALTLEYAWSNRLNEFDLAPRQSFGLQWRT